MMEKAAWWHGGPSRSEVIARSVVKGGSTEIYELLKRRDPEMWKAWHEIQFLPLAAEQGQLDFARFSVLKGCDWHPKLNRKDLSGELGWHGKIQYPGDVRYFALLRAVLSGHLDIVRWLIEDVGVDVNNKAGLGIYPELLPLILAVDAGRVAIVKLLRWELGADPIPEEMTKTFMNTECQERRKRQLDDYRKALHFREDYVSTHYCTSKAIVVAALEAVSARAGPGTV